MGVATLLLWRFDGDAASAALGTWLASGKREVQADHAVLQRATARVRAVAAARRQLDDSLTAVLDAAKALQAQGQGLASRARTAQQMQAATVALAHAHEGSFDGLT